MRGMPKTGQVLLLTGLLVGPMYVGLWSGLGLVRRMVAQEVEKLEWNQMRDLAVHAQRIASEESARFVNEHMAKTPVFADKFALLRHSLAAVDPKQEGSFCEFGVATGTTINYLAALSPRPWHGFDSFEGLPEDWRTGFAKGHFAQTLPPVRSNVALHKGWFSDSLPVWVKEHPGPVLFLHMDADLYSSTRTVFDLLGDRIVPGTVIQFDEFFNYPGWREGECKAFLEFVAARRIQFEYLGYCARDEQVAVKITDVGR